MNIGFHSNQLCERGTEIALYDYAYYIEKLYGYTSSIFYCKKSSNNDPKVIKKFEDKFKCFAYDKFNEIEEIIKEYDISYFYNIIGGRNSGQLVKNCKNLIHAVFVADPHGDKYAVISPHLSKSLPCVPHMINLPDNDKNMRSVLNIPKDAIVLGRIGGYDTFDICYVQDVIAKTKNIYFLMVNTKRFSDNIKIIYLDKIIDQDEKVEFINTCDAMIYARAEGESFGIAIGEFSSKNKPIICNRGNTHNTHLDILGDKAIIYDNSTELNNILFNIENILKFRSDWNAYRDYTPEKIMKKFVDIFLK